MKGKGHVNRKRNELGKMMSEARVKEMIKANKNSPVVTYNINITINVIEKEKEKGNFEVYKKRMRKPKYNHIDPKNNK